jgi:hypothetical protein
MTKRLMPWIVTVVVTGLEFGMLTLWKGYGMTPAGNVLLFWIWLSAIVGIFSLFSKPTSPGEPKSRLRSAVSGITDIALISALAWFGYFVTATFFVLGVIGWQAYRSKFDADGRPLPQKPNLAE